jgi:hypothetical protein
MGLIAAIFGPEIFAQSAQFSPFYHTFRQNGHSPGSTGGCGGCGGGGCGGGCGG